MRDGPVGFSLLLRLRGCFQTGEQLGELPAKFFRVGDLGFVGSQVFQQARHVVKVSVRMLHLAKVVNHAVASGRYWLDPRLKRKLDAASDQKHNLERRPVWLAASSRFLNQAAQKICKQ